MFPKPIIKAFLICDSAITEIGTGKKSLIGIFERILTPKFPCIHHKLTVYVNLTDIQPIRYKFTLLLKDLKENQIIGKGETEWIKIPEKTRTYEFVFNLQGIRFVHPGKYEFELHGNGEHLDLKTFEVAQGEIKKK